MARCLNVSKNAPIEKKKEKEERKNTFPDSGKRENDVAITLVIS
jgi:hypothetical protein